MNYYSLFVFVKGYEVAEECVRCLPVVIKDTLKTLRNINEIEDALAKSFEKVDKGKLIKITYSIPVNVF